MEQVIKGEVTQEDIDSSNLSDPLHHCVVANALHRMFPEKHISVGLRQAELDGREYLTDENTYKQIYKWTTGKKVRPFSFTLTLAASSWRANEV